MAHGLGDTALALSQLARHMHVSHPIYGMQARGLDGLEQPLDRIEDMAQYHLDAIRQLQPHGPYILVGYSLGGLVTLEIARRLSANGDDVALLAMLDSYPDRHQLSLRQRVCLDWRLAMRRVAALVQVGGHSDQSTVTPMVRTAVDRIEVDESIARALQRVREAQYRALRVYRPCFYSGKVKFVRAAIPSYFPSDPVPVWSHLAQEFEVETVPGIHLELLTTQSETLASVVERYVEESRAGRVMTPQEKRLA